MFERFNQLIPGEFQGPRKKAAIVWANDSHTLEAVLSAYRNGFIQPILIGEKDDLAKRLHEMGCDEPLSIVAAYTPEEAVDIAIDLVKQGEADLIVKGLLETSTLMRKIVKKEVGICVSPVMFHLMIFQVEGYHKLIAITDSALLLRPNFVQKVSQVKDAVAFLNRLGWDDVKVALLAAVEHVNPKMQETVEADEIKQMWQRGELQGCTVEGPISYDLAMRPDAAAAKGYTSAVAGDADLLVVPDLVSGNILSKTFGHIGKGFGGGVVLGAKVPIIITSRSSTVKTKYMSICLAASTKQ